MYSDFITEIRSKIGYDVATTKKYIKGAMTMKAINITRNSFDSEVIRSEQKVLLDFWAPWCAPCRMVSPILDEIAAERPDIKVCKVNVDEEMELARRFRVLSIPTLMVMQDGQVEHKMTGARGKAQILAAL